MSEPPPEEPDEQLIKVNVYVGRFERDGALSGPAALPIAVMSRVGFDYATILPDGTMALLASIVADGKPGPFKIYHLAFAKPSPYLAALQKAVGRARDWAYPPPVADIFPIAEPKAVIVAAVERGRGYGPGRSGANPSSRSYLARLNRSTVFGSYFWTGPPAFADSTVLPCLLQK
jgi:hypothetical protein